MEPDTRYSIIGAVVLLLSAAAVAAYLWLDTSGRAAGFHFYTVYFERQSLEGLQVGGSVNMRGIAVGRVEGYEIQADNINRVQVTLRVARDTPVSDNTYATVTRNLLTGIARINLVTPGTPGPELVAVAPGERYPVIPEGLSSTDQFTDSLKQLTLTADQALGNANRVLGPDNQRAFAELLVQLRDLARGLNARLATVDQVALEIRTSAAAFGKATTEIASAATRIATAAEPLARDAGSALRDASSALHTLTEATRKVEQDLTRTLQRVDRDGGALITRADAALDVSVLELRATAAELRRSADAVARTLDNLREPRAALLGPSRAQLGPGETQ